MRLIKSEIDAAACPPDRRDVLLFDDDLTGFALRITSTGARIFIFQYRRGGVVRRLRLGTYGEITPAQARKLAEQYRGQVAAGRDPVAERKSTLAAESAERQARKRKDASDSFTLGRLLESWSELALSRRRPRYRDEALRTIKQHLGGQMDRPASSITPRELQETVDSIIKPAGTRKRGPAASGGQAPGEASARRLRAYGHAAYAWAVKRGLVDANPFAPVLVESRDAQRDRVLTDGEIAEVWRALEALGWPWCHYFRVLLLTLQRETEVAGMAWSELNDEMTAWTLPAARAKNGRPNEIHLAEPVRAILRELREQAEEEHAAAVAAADRAGRAPPQAPRLVFTTTGTTPLSGFGHAKQRLDKAIQAARVKAAKSGATPAAMPGWVLHDFRRTGVTVMARLGVRWEVADKVLGHTAGVIRGVAAVYQRHEFLAERAAALDAWAAHVIGAAEQRAASSNVVELRPTSKPRA